MSLSNTLRNWWVSLHGRYPATIQLGSSGADVGHWQEVIGVEPQDGSFGPITDQKTREYQSSHGIDPDGVVGPITWKAAFDGVGTADKPNTTNIPPGTRRLPQGIANRPAITAFALRVLKDSSVGMGQTANEQIEGVNVLARIEPHTWTHRNGKLVTNLNPPIRGVTLYEVVSQTGFGFDTGIYQVSKHGADPMMHQRSIARRDFDYGVTDSVTNREGGGMSNIGGDYLYTGNKSGKLKL